MASEKKTSPFSEKELIAGKKRAFKVVSFLAFISFFCMAAGVYTRFFKSPEIKTVYYLTKPEIRQTSLVNPQPPEEKQSPEEMAATSQENLQLIQELEKEHTDIEQTAEALREIIQSSPETAGLIEKSVLPETPELQKLQQEKDMEEQKKLEEIEKLHQLRMERENEKSAAPDMNEEKASAERQETAVVEKSGIKPDENIPSSENGQKIIPVNLKEPTPPDPMIGARSDLPHPDLIQTNLMGSLPDFSLIKKAASQTVIPLHIIDPLPELQETSRYGKLPVEKTGKTPFSAYGKSLETPPATPYIAILFSGLGKRDNATRSAITSLPDVVSLSFSPYTEKLKTYITDARKTGHETLLDLPMQQGMFPETDPGPLGLVSGLPEQENRKRLHKVLGQDVAYIGLTAASNENFSYSGSQMKPFFDEIEQRGLIYIDGTDNPRMPLFKDALRPDIHIANEFHRAAIRVRLEKARQIALEKGFAFVRIETVPISLLTTIEWMKSLEPTEKNPVPEVTFVPLSYYVAQRKKNEQ